MLDESEPLAGLLRKCLLLGAETGSVTLREWARKELNGYGDVDETPDHRTVAGWAISMDSISGNTWTKGQVIDRHQLPRKAWEYVPETLTFKQPVEELEELAGQPTLSFVSSGLAMAASIWNEQLGPFQSVVGLSYVMSGSVVAGILGQIRTRLVDLIADLTAETPLLELPRKEQVDAAVDHRIGHFRDVYNTTIHTADGPVAIGEHANARSEGISIEDALLLLDEVSRAAADVEGAHRTELLEAVADLRAAVAEKSPDTGDVVRKIGRLRAVANKIGVASVAGAAGGAAQALTELAVGGAFG